MDHGLAQLAKKIMCSNDPAAQKYYGGRADDSPSWLAKCEHVLYVGVYAKFSQSEELCAKLLGTGNSKLFEATKDERFGCGLSLKSDRWSSPKPNGGNAQGVILNEVRDELREKFGISVEVDMEGPQENTLCDLATQTLAPKSPTPKSPTDEVTEGKSSSSETLEGWLGDSTRIDYEQNYPYLAKAKSPPMVYSSHVSDRRSTKPRGRKSGSSNRGARNSSLTYTSNNKDISSNRAGLINQELDEQNKQEYMARKNSRGKSPRTSTPARNLTQNNNMRSSLSCKKMD